jgi:hypothetical protein
MPAIAGKTVVLGKWLRTSRRHPRAGEDPRQPDRGTAFPLRRRTQLTRDEAQPDEFDAMPMHAHD